MGIPIHIVSQSDLQRLLISVFVNLKLISHKSGRKSLRGLLARILTGSGIFDCIFEVFSKYFDKYTYRSMLATVRWALPNSSTFSGIILPGQKFPDSVILNTRTSDKNTNQYLTSFFLLICNTYEQC